MFLKCGSFSISSDSLYEYYVVSMSKLRNPIKNILNQTFPDREQKREDSFRGEAGPAGGGGGGQTAEFQLKYRPHYSHGNFPTFFKRGS